MNQKKLLKKYAKTWSNQYMDTMDTAFLNSKNSQTSKPHVLILKFTNKLDLRRSENRIALSNLSIYYT